MTDEDAGTGGARPAWAVVGTLLLAVGWAVLAWRNPDTTYHLAPALVAWAYPYLRLSGTSSGRRQAVGAVGESLLVAGLAAVIAVVVASFRAAGGE